MLKPVHYIYFLYLLSPYDSALYVNVIGDKQRIVTFGGKFIEIILFND